MFCSHCGNEINDNQNFCTLCGSKISKKEITHTEKTALLINESNDFNKNVLNNYLYNIRSLESAKVELNKKRDSIVYKVNSLQLSYTINPKNIVCDSIKIIVTVAVTFVLFLLEICIAVISFCKTNNAVTFILRIFIALITLIVGIILSILSAKKEKKKEYNKLLNNNKKMIEYNNKLKTEYLENINKIDNELDIQNEILTEAYSANIIPSKYRNIYAIYFLYDYISTSNCTLSEALFHCDLDSIEQKLSDVIKQQNEIIVQLAYNNAINEKITKQNYQILQNAIQTEKNTALAAQYNKVAAANTSSIRYFQSCEWLGISPKYFT